MVHYGDPAPTRCALRALVADGSAVRRTLVVVDAGGLDPASAALADQVVESADNPGYGASANRGIRRLTHTAAESDFAAYLVLNHDVRIEPGFLARAATVCQQRVGAAGGPLRRSDGSLWYAGGGVRWLTGTVIQHRDERRASRAHDVRFIPATALVVQPAAWHEIGGFDPYFFLYNEDVDLCLRLSRRGWRLRFDPALCAVHDLGTATGSSARSALYLEHLARGRLRPFSPWPYRLYLALLHSAWVAVRAAGLLVRHGRAGGPRARALVRGHAAALASLIERRETSLGAG